MIMVFLIAINLPVYFNFNDVQPFETSKNQLKVVGKMNFIDSRNKDALTFEFRKDYISQFDTIDGSILISFIDKDKFMKIKKLKLMQIDIFIDGIEHIAKPQSFFCDSIPTSEFFFITSNLGYIATSPNAVFYLDKKESFSKKSFLERVIKANYKYLSDPSH